ncbi:MAG: hypothetical protein CMH53_01775 [Myxococcales bacterium]|nr:hypothetical protein [Myxococcales bacterium]
MTATQPSRALPASTVVVLRDCPEALGQPEVFLVRRHGASGFMAGATVFPGGKVDPADYRVTSAGQSAEQCALSLQMSDHQAARAYYIAAIRELHEEAEIVLARTSKGTFADPKTLSELHREMRALRQGHRIEADAVHALWQRHGLQPALDCLHPFAWWVTPSVEPKRFDTRFFVATLPAGQQGHIDGFETTAQHWLSAESALQEHERGGDLYLPPPTLHTLQRIASLRGPSADIAKRLTARGIGPKIEPFVQRQTDGSPMIALPDDPIHPQSDHADPRRNRFVMRQGRFHRQFTGDDLM